MNIILFHLQVLNLFEFNRLLAFRMRAKVALLERDAVPTLFEVLLHLLKLKSTCRRHMLLAHELLLLLVLGKLCHCLLLNKGTLMTLALQYPLLTLVLGDARNLRLVLLAGIASVGLEAAIAFGGTGTLLLAAICRSMALLHDISL